MTASPAPFYWTQGNLPRDASSYVPRQADDELYEGLRRGEYCYALTSRQMGKSSLMVRTAQRLRADGITVVLLSLEAVGQNVTVEQWYEGLLAVVGRQLKLEDELDAYWLAHERRGPLQRWMGALREVVLPRCPGPVVVSVDEVDAVRSLKFSTDEFFAAAREFYNRRAEDPELARLTFCLLGVAAPSDLIRDTRTTPFNIGRRIELHDFTPGEAEPLARGLSGGGPKGGPLLRRVLYWTGGNPYLTQRLCRAVAEDAKASSPAGVDRVCRALFLAPGARDRDDNLLFVRDQLYDARRPGEDQVALLDLYEQVRRGRRVANEETNRLVTLLRLSGAVRVEGGQLRVRNRIYQRVFDRAWVQANLPGAEQRRQRRAFRRGVLGTSLVAAALMAVLGGLGWLAWTQSRHAWNAEIERDVVKVERDKATAARDDANAALEKANQAGIKLVEAKGEAERLRAQATQEAEKAQDWAAQLDVSNGFGLQGAGNLTGALVWFADALQRDRGGSGRERAHRLRLAAALEQCPRPLRVWSTAGSVEHAEFSPDGRRILAVRGTEVSVRDVATGAVQATVWGPEDAGDVHFGPDGRWLFAEGDSATRVWDADTGRPRPEPWRQKDWVTKFSADGSRLLAEKAGERARLWDTASGKPVGNELPMVRGSVFSPDGQRFLTLSAGGKLRVWHSRTGKPAGEEWPSPERLYQVAFSRDGRLVATFNRGGTNQVWDVAAARAVGQCDAPAGWVRWATFAKGDRWLLMIGDDPGKKVRVYDVSANQMRQELDSGGEITRRTLSRDGRWLATSGTDHVVRLVDLDPSGLDPAEALRVVTLEKHAAAVRDVQFSPDGRYVVTACEDGTARVWHTATGEAVTPPLVHAGPVNRASFSPDGQLVLTASADGSVRLWDLATGSRPLAPEDGARRIRQAVCSADGGRVLTVDEDGTASVCEVATGRRVALPLAAGEWVSKGWISPGGERVLTSGEGGRARVWDVGGARPVPLVGQAGEVLACAFGAGGRRLVTVSRRPGEGDEREARLWNAATGKKLADLAHGNLGGAAVGPAGEVAVASDKVVLLWGPGGRGAPRQLTGHSAAVTSLAFSGDGRRLVSGATGRDRALRVWDVARGESLRTFRLSAPVTSAVLSRDGQLLLTASEDNTARIWDVGTGKLATGEPLQHGKPVTQAAFDADERLVITASEDSTARVWDARTGKPVTPPLLHPAAVRDARLGVGCRRLVVITADQRPRVWDLGCAAEPAAQLLRLVRLRSASRLTDGGERVLPLDPGQLPAAPGQDSGTAAPDEATAWHWQEAANAAAEKNWGAVLWHLDRLAEKSPSSALFVRRGNVYLNLGKFDEAMNQYDRAARCARPEPALPWLVARASLVRGEATSRKWSVARALACFEAASEPQGIGPRLVPAALAVVYPGTAVGPLPWYEDCERRLNRCPAEHPLTLRVKGELLRAYVRAGEQSTDRGDPPSAGSALQKCRALLASLKGHPEALPWSAAERTRLARSWKYFGDARLKKNDRDLARLAYQASLGLWDVGGEAMPEEDDDRLAVFVLLTGLGDLSPRPGDQGGFLAYYRRALAVAEARVKAVPDNDNARQNLGFALDGLGSQMLNQGAIEEADKYYKAALANDQAWVQSAPGNDRAREMLAYSYTHMGDVAQKREDTALAQSFYEKARGLREPLAAKQPENVPLQQALAETYKGLGLLCRTVGDRDLAQRYCERQLQVIEALAKRSSAKEFQSGLVKCYEDLGRAFSEMQAPARSATYWREALQRREAVLKVEPDNGEALRGAAEALEWLADLELRLGDVRAACDYARRCVARKEKLCGQNPADPAARRALSYAYVWLGTTGFAAGEVQEAREALEKSLTLRQKLAGPGPEDREASKLLAKAHEELGTFWLRLGSADRAEGHLRQALDIRKRLAKDAQDPDASRELALAHDWVGKVGLERNDLAAARASFRQALDIAEARVAKSSDVLQRQLDVAVDQVYLGRVEMQAGDLAEAEKWFQGAQTIYRKLEAEKKLSSPEDQKALRNLTRQLDACRAARKGHDPKLAPGQQSREAAADLLILRAAALARRGDFQAALAAAEALRKLAPEDVDNRYDVARCYVSVLHAVVRGRPPEQLSPEERTARTTCATRAMEALAGAIRGGFHDGARLFTDEDLAILRPEPGYRDLVRRFEERPGPK